MLAEKIIQTSNQFSKRGIPLKRVLERLQIARSCFYYQQKRKEGPDDEHIRQRIRELAMTYKTYGYKKITVLLKAEGFKVNHKRVYRIWKEEGFNRYIFFKSKKRHKKREASFTPTVANYAGHIWAIDFIHDSLENGRSFRVFNVIDVYSRRAFEPVIDFSLPGKVVAEHLEGLFKRYGPPRVIRRDDGPEFKSRYFQTLMSRWNIEQEVIPPGQPFNNGHIESFHSLLRRECLNREIFIDVMDARDKIRSWIEDYNTKRLHSALGYWVPMKVWETRNGFKNHEKTDTNINGVQVRGSL